MVPNASLSRPFRAGMLYGPVHFLLTAKSTMPRTNSSLRLARPIDFMTSIEIPANTLQSRSLNCMTVVVVDGVDSVGACCALAEGGATVAESIVNANAFEIVEVSLCNFCPLVLRKCGDWFDGSNADLVEHNFVAAQNTVDCCECGDVLATGGDAVGAGAFLVDGKIDHPANKFVA
jgi:hypothetical protein